MGRRSECIGKVRHADKESAFRASKARRRYGATQAQANIYMCRYCGGFHTGRKMARKR